VWISLLLVGFRIFRISLRKNEIFVNFSSKLLLCRSTCWPLGVGPSSFTALQNTPYGRQRFPCTGNVLYSSCTWGIDSSQSRWFVHVLLDLRKRIGLLYEICVFNENCSTLKLGWLLYEIRWHELIALQEIWTLQKAVSFFVSGAIREKKNWIWWGTTSATSDCHLKYI